MSEPTDKEVEETDSDNEEETEDSLEDPQDQGEPEVKIRKPWSNRQERADFFKKKNQSHDDDSEDDVSAIVQRELQKALAPVQDVISKAQAESEIVTFLSNNPSFKKHEVTARKYMQSHPTLVAEDAFFLAAKELPRGDKSQAEDKVKRGSLGGGSVRKEVSTLPSSQKEMKSVMERVKRGETVKFGE